MTNLKHSDTMRSFLLGLADLISRYENVEFNYYTSDDGIYVTVNNETVNLGYDHDSKSLHAIANTIDEGTL